MTAPPAASAPRVAVKEFGPPILPAVQLTRVRFLAEGRSLVAAAFDGTIKRWDVTAAAARELPPVTGHNGWVSDLAVAGAVLFSVDSWGRLRATDLSAREPRPLWTVEAAHDGWARAVALSRDGSRLATCGHDGFIRFWDPRTGHKTGEFAARTDQLSLCFAADGTTVFAGDLFGTIRQLADGREARTFVAKELHKVDRIQDVGGVRGLLLSGDGRTLFAFGAEPKGGGFVQAVPLLLAFELESGRRVGQYKGTNDNQGYVTDAAWHPAGFLAFTTSGQPGQGQFHLWKPSDPAPFVSGGRFPNCHSLALSPDGTRLAVSATNANSNGNGRVKGSGGEYPANTSPVQLWTLTIG